MATLDRRIPPATPSHNSNTATEHNHAGILSSSPAFATPAHPIPPPPQPQPDVPQAPAANAIQTSHVSRPAPILPILLPPPTLRPIAFRTFTKKHNLTLTSTALQALASFIGKNCGAGWREEGLGELVLEEVARAWKKSQSSVIVDGEGDTLRNILKQIEAQMSGGRIIVGKAKGGLTRHGSLIDLEDMNRPGVERNESQDSFGMSALEVEEDEEDEEESEKTDPRAWLKVVGAFDQPRMVYNASTKQFEKSKQPATLFPSPQQKTEVFRQRYQLIHQRLLRNESFQTPTVSRREGSASAQQAWKLTSISNLRGRSGTGHLLLGLLTVAATGTLAISDLTGSIALDLEQASSIDDVETWLCPGMIVLVDGIYEEEYSSAGGSLGNVRGIGGTIGGRFTGFSIGAPRCETRAVSLGLTESNSNGDASALSGGFGWIDFLGVGSERAAGSRMRKMEQKLIHRRLPEHRTNTNKVVLLGEVNLDVPKTLSALRKILEKYSEDSTHAPLAFILLGNFVNHAAMSGLSHADSISYKEHFDALASLLSDFPQLLRSSTWIFVPGDNDPWPSAFSAGASTALPRNGIPDMFSSRIKRAFANANAEARNPKGAPGEAVWTTNPSRVSLFGPSMEMVLFRDDMSGRLRRNAVPLKSQAGEHSHSASSTHQDLEMSGTLPLPPSSQPEVSQNTNANEDPMSVDPLPSSPPTATDPEAEISQDNSTEPISPHIAHARRLTKTLLDQSHLSPFPLSIRPQHWSYAPSLSLYPLPNLMVLCDSECDAFVVTYQGCCVVNPGKLVGSDAGGKARGKARWAEWDVGARKGVVRECEVGR